MGAFSSFPKHSPPLNKETGARLTKRIIKMSVELLIACWPFGGSLPLKFQRISQIIAENANVINGIGQVFKSGVLST